MLRVKETAETAKENLLGSLGAVADSTPLAGALASVPSEPMNLMESSADTWGWGSLPDDTPAGARLDQLSTIPESMQMKASAEHKAVQAATSGIDVHEAGEGRGAQAGATGVSVESAIHTLNREISHDTQAMMQEGEKASRDIDSLAANAHADLATRRPSIVRGDELAEEDGGEAHVNGFKEGGFSPISIFPKEKAPAPSRAEVDAAARARTVDNLQAATDDIKALDRAVRNPGQVNQATEEEAAQAAPSGAREVAFRPHGMELDSSMAEAFRSFRRDEAKVAFLKKEELRDDSLARSDSLAEAEARARAAQQEAEGRERQEERARVQRLADEFKKDAEAERVSAEAKAAGFEEARSLADMAGDAPEQRDFAAERLVDSSREGSAILHAATPGLHAALQHHVAVARSELADQESRAGARARAAEVRAESARAERLEEAADRARMHHAVAAQEVQAAEAHAVNAVDAARTAHKMAAIEQHAASEVHATRAAAAAREAHDEKALKARRAEEAKARAAHAAAENQEQAARREALVAGEAAEREAVARRRLAAKHEAEARDSELQARHEEAVAAAKAREAQRTAAEEARARVEAKARREKAAERAAAAARALKAREAERMELQAGKDDAGRAARVGAGAGDGFARGVAAATLEGGRAVQQLIEHKADRAAARLEHLKVKDFAAAERRKAAALQAKWLHAAAEQRAATSTEFSSADPLEGGVGGGAAGKADSVKAAEAQADHLLAALEAKYAYLEAGPAAAPQQALAGAAAAAPVAPGDQSGRAAARRAYHAVRGEVMHAKAAERLALSQLDRARAAAELGVGGESYARAHRAEEAHLEALALLRGKVAPPPPPPPPLPY